jgi:transposase
MSYYIGLDISDKTTFICVIDQEGKIIYETNTLTDPKYINLEFQKLEFKIEAVGIETGGLSNWLVGSLRKLGWNVLCLDSFKMAKLISMNINKTDLNDARMIAEAVRINCFSIIQMEVHTRSENARSFRCLIKAREYSVRNRIGLYHHIRGMLKDFGVLMPSAKPEVFCDVIKKVMKELPSCVKVSVLSFLRIYETLTQEINDLTKTLEAISKQNEDVQRLTEIPGVGKITALYFLTIIDDPKRFENSKDVGAYLGLTPIQYSSGQSEKQCGISKRGDKTMRSLLYECSMVLLFRTKRTCELKRWGLKKVKKKRNQESCHSSCPQVGNSNAPDTSYKTTLHRKSTEAKT